MESLLWALDLCAVVYLCLWALRTDKRRAKEAELAQRAAQQAAGDASTYTGAPARKEGRHA